ADLFDLATDIFHSHLEHALPFGNLARCAQVTSEQPGDEDDQHHQHPGESNGGVDHDEAPFPVDDLVRRDLGHVHERSPIARRLRRTTDTIAVRTISKPTSPARIRSVWPSAITTKSATVIALRTRKLTAANNIGCLESITFDNVQRRPPKKKAPANVP